MQNNTNELANPHVSKGTLEDLLANGGQQSASQF